MNLDEFLHKKRSTSEIHELSLSQFERARIEYNRDKMIIGSPKTIMKKLEELSERFNVNEIMLVTITHSHKAKETSFRLIAKEAGLAPS